MFFKDMKIGNYAWHLQTGAPIWKIKPVKDKKGKVFNAIYEDDMKLIYVPDSEEFIKP